ncbi:hypothetical protein Aperf_G00000131059 [Anoplocephala perfoliata]
MLGLAVSALFSASILLLIPESLELEVVPLDYGSQGYDLLAKLLCILAGLLFFYLIEYLLLTIPHIFCLRKPDDISGDDYNIKAEVDGDNVLDLHRATTPDAPKKRSCCLRCRLLTFTNVAPVAWMILLGDSVHNFMDGMAIAAGFSESSTTGITICICVLLEELPHELGDFAVLISSGLSVKTALCVNFMSAGAAYLGLIVGLLIGGAASGAFFVFATMSGIFLYVSLSDMSLELAVKSNNPSFGLFAFQFAGLIVGCCCVCAAMFGSHLIEL